jgi:hypothetical protein
MKHPNGDVSDVQEQRTPKLPMNTNKRQRRVPFPAALLALSLFVNGCHTLDVESTTDKETDFSKFRTFNFSEPATSTNQPHLTAQNRQRIQSAVVEEMTKRSWSLADKPDILFSIDLATSIKTYNRANPDVESGSLGANLSQHYGLKYNSDSSQPVVSYTEGTLSFEAYATNPKRLVWEGQALGTLYQDRPDEQVQQRIREAVQAVFKQFPAKPAGK